MLGAPGKKTRSWRNSVGPDLPVDRRQTATDSASSVELWPGHAEATNGHPRIVDVSRSDCHFGTTT